MSLPEYVRRLTHLRTDVNAAHYPNQPDHRAPHKPLLLLSVMDPIAEGTLTANLVELTAEGDRAAVDRGCDEHHTDRVALANCRAQGYSSKRAMVEGIQRSGP